MMVPIKFAYKKRVWISIYICFDNFRITLTQRKMKIVLLLLNVYSAKQPKFIENCSSIVEMSKFSVIGTKQGQNVRSKTKPFLEVRNCIVD